MLLSHEYQFIVGLPTKCGTNSMRNMGIKSNRSGRAHELHEIRELRHRMDVPEGCGSYTRAIVIRNPFSRLVSMYEYLRRHSWEWKYSWIMEQERKHGRELAWNHFLHMMIDEQLEAAEKPYWARKVHGKRPFIWTDTLTELRAFLGGYDERALADKRWPVAEVQVLRLEALAADWAAFTEHVGWRNAPVPARNNATKDEDKLFPAWRDYYSKPNLRLARMIVGADVELPAVERHATPGL